jgi:hypothetical protein
MKKTIQTWLKAFKLTQEQAVLAALLLSLAGEYDAKPTVQVGAEIRKTRSELAKLIASETEDVDPLAEMLKRGQ